MNPLLKYLTFFLFGIILHQSQVFGQNLINSAVNQFKNEKINRNSSISIKAVDVNSNEILAEYNADSAIISASTTKLFSTYAALSILGQEYRNSTKLYMEGSVSNNGVLHGNLWIKGGGDISLSSRYFDYAPDSLSFLKSWIDSLKKMGVTQINGAIISDGSSHGYKGAPLGWGKEDLGNYYGSHAQGINFYDNTVLVGFNTSSPGKNSSINFIWPEMDSLSFENEVKSANIKNDRAYLFGEPYQYNRIAKGSLPAYKDTFVVKGSMPDPEFLLAKLFVKELSENGISVSQGGFGVREYWFLEKGNYEEMFLVSEILGATTLDIVQVTNHKSVNLFAEGLLNSIGYVKFQDGSTDKSIQCLYDFYGSKFDIGGLILNDGSGLSRENRISANHFISLLKEIHSSDIFEQFYNSLPIAGKSGTVKSLCSDKSGEGRIHAKSGTLSNVKSYVGYIESKSGRTIAFAFTVNDFSCTNYQIVKYMENVLNALSEI